MTYVLRMHTGAANIIIYEPPPQPPPPQRRRTTDPATLVIITLLTDINLINAMDNSHRSSLES